MDCKDKCHDLKQKCGYEVHRKSSYHMQDSSMVFNELALNEGDRVLDLGCGAGDYSFHAAGIVGPGGSVYSIDGQKDTIAHLSARIQSKGMTNIQALELNFVKTALPFEDNQFDYCFIFTVLHCLRFPKDGQLMFQEIHRVLKPGAQLAVIECKKDNLDYGPPLEIRLSADEVANITAPYGFARKTEKDLGFNYMIHFSCV